MKRRTFLKSRLLRQPAPWPYLMSILNRRNLRALRCASTDRVAFMMTYLEDV